MNSIVFSIVKSSINIHILQYNKMFYLLIMYELKGKNEKEPRFLKVLFRPTLVSHLCTIIISCIYILSNRTSFYSYFCESNMIMSSCVKVEWP